MLLPVSDFQRQMELQSLDDTRFWSTSHLSDNGFVAAFICKILVLPIPIGTVVALHNKRLISVPSSYLAAPHGHTARELLFSGNWADKQSCRTAPTRCSATAVFGCLQQLSLQKNTILSPVSHNWRCFIQFARVLRERCSGNGSCLSPARQALQQGQARHALPRSGTRTQLSTRYVPQYDLVRVGHEDQEVLETDQAAR